MKSQDSEHAVANAPADAEENSPLLFAWEPARNRRRIPRRLLVLLGISAFGHIGSFYGLQVLYTTPAALPPAPAQITLLPPRSSASQALEQWLAVADPALAISAPPAAPGFQALADLPVLRYVPSFAANGAGRGTGLDSLLDELDAAATHKGTVTEAIGSSAQASRNLFSPSAARKESARQEPRSLTADVSMLHLSASLQRRLGVRAGTLPLALPALTRTGETLPAAAAATLSPTVLLVYVSPEGGPSMVFLQNSSGRAEVDEAARDFLVQYFTTAPRGEGTWGEATVFWGRDAYR